MCGCQTLDIEIYTSIYPSNCLFSVAGILQKVTGKLASILWDLGGSPSQSTITYTHTLSHTTDNLDVFSCFQELQEAPEAQRENLYKFRQGA